MNKTLSVTLLFCVLAATAKADDATGLQLVEARRIWGRAPHTAFTDLIRFKKSLVLRILRLGDS